jgi:hypothetical protein
VIVADTMGEYDEALVCYDSLAMAEYLEKNEQFRVSFRALEDSDYEMVCRIARAKGNCDLILEEVSHCCSTSKLNPAFRAAILRGRHSCLSTIYTTQRFAEVHRTVTSMTDEFYLFRQFEPRDLQACQDRFGPIVAEKVSSLNDLEFIKVGVKGFKADEPENYCLMGTVGWDRGVVYHGSLAETSNTGASSSSERDSAESDSGEV